MSKQMNIQFHAKKHEIIDFVRDVIDENNIKAYGIVLFPDYKAEEITNFDDAKVFEYRFIILCHNEPEIGSSEQYHEYLKQENGDKVRRGGIIEMSMEHKAFLFDTAKYHAEIEKIIEACCSSGEISSVKQYIDEHLEEFSSPYTWEPLEQSWEQELENGDMQEYFDFLLTACYDCEQDIGLSYAWDAVNEAVKQLGFIDSAEKCVLGTEVSFHGIVVDPGQMGLGIVDAEEIKGLKEKLLENKEKLEDMPLPDDLMYDMEPDELFDAYDDLCDIYKKAEKEGKGILFTF